MDGSTIPDDDAVRAMASRLAVIDWTRRGEKTWSKIALAKEYFRRVALVANAYGSDARNPFFDVAASVAPDLRLDEDAVARMARDLSPGEIGLDRILGYVLRWAALGDRRPATLDDPFEPLLVMFERGGAFGIANGLMEFEYGAVRIGGWRKRAGDPPLASLAPDALDAIDRAGSIKQFGEVVDPW